MALLVLIISMMMQEKFAPFYTPTLNRMEIYSMQVSALTMFAGIFYVTGSHYTYMKNDGLKWFFLCVIVVPNIAFLLYWLNAMRIEFFKLVFQKSKRLFNLLTCGYVNIDKFEDKYFSSEDD